MSDTRARYNVTPPSPQDTQWVDLQVDSAGNLKVNATPNSATSSVKAEDAGHTSGDIGDFTLGVRNDTNAALTNTDLDYTPLAVSSSGQQIVKEYAAGGADWSYAAATGGISNTTTAVTMKTAAGAGLRNYLTGLDISTDGALGAATEVAVRDGAAGTVIWRCKLGTAGLAGGRSIQFLSPLKGTGTNLLEVVTLTASVTGAVFVNAQGYVGP